MEIKPMDKTIISLCGGSGSGKSHLAKQLAGRLGLDQAVRVPTDFYLKPRDGLSMEAFIQHPLEYDWDLFDRMLCEPSGTMVSSPAYDFVSYHRISELGGRCFILRPVVITDGMLPHPGADLTILLTCPDAERKRRIVERDQQWQTNVIAYWDLHQRTLETLRECQAFNLELDGLDPPEVNVERIYALWISKKV